MLAALPLLLGRESKSQVVVKRTVYVSLMRIAATCRCGKRPSFLVESGGIGKHAPQVVVTVGIAHGSLAAGSIGRCTHIYIFGTAQCSESKGRGCGEVGYVTVAGHVIQCSNRGIIKHSAVLVIKLHAVDVFQFLRTGIAARRETGGRQLIGGAVQKDIVREDYGGAHILRSVLHIVIHHACVYHANHGDVFGGIQLGHLNGFEFCNAQFFHFNGYTLRSNQYGVELYDMASRLQITENEITVCIGSNLSVLPGQSDDDSGYRLIAHCSDYTAFHRTCTLSKGETGEEECNEEQ